MRKVLLATGLGVVLGVVAPLAAGAARADDALDQLAKDPKQWVMQQGDDANTRFSKLNQINASNVKKLQVAWTFSTGVLRGHEGGPLVIGDVMYVHTPFPNTVYALDLNHDGKLDLIYGQGHGYGLYWLEQAGTPTHRKWIRHTIDESFSQSHALALVDIDGDGIPELITGKRYRGHSGNDPGSYDPVVVYA